MSVTKTASPMIGRSIPRIDGVAKINGSALYIDDIVLDHMLYGATLRSEIAHGTLIGLYLDPDFSWDEVTVVTAADIPGSNVVTLIVDDQVCLVPVGGKIRHMGEALALVSAPSREMALAAVKAIRIEANELPGVFTIEDSIEKKVLLHEDDNIFSSYQILKGNEEDLEKAFASADHIMEGTYRTGAQEQMYIEPQGMIAHWDESGCHIIGSMQCPYYVHKAMKPLLNLDDSNLSVSQAVTGGGFGGKEEYPSMLAGHVALLAKKAGAPVKIIYDREEDIVATTKRHPSKVHHRMGFMNDGSIVAIDVDVIFDSGAYATLSSVVLSRGVLHAAGPYSCEHTRIRGRAVATNVPPHGAFRGFGAPQTTFAYERQCQKAARLLKMDPFEFRRKNMLVANSSTATCQTLRSSIGSKAVLDAVQETLAEKPSSLVTTQPHLRRGRGLAFYFHGAGFTGSGEERLSGRVTVALTKDGRFEVRSSSTDIGQGATTIFAQIASGALGIPPEQIHVPQPNTKYVPDSGPTVASRTCMVVGAVVERAAFDLRKKIEQWCVENNHECSDLSSAAQKISASLGEVSVTTTYKPPKGIQWDDATYTGSAYPCYGWAACIIDVEVDIDTYETKVLRCIHAVDVGKAIHPVIVKGQIEGGTLQAIGWALWENVTYNEGRLIQRNMTNCIVPTSADAPEMETLIIEEPYAHGPHGAKGVGEIPMDGPGAAIAAAIENALDHPFDTLPILPETIAAELRN